MPTPLERAAEAVEDPPVPRLRQTVPTSYFNHAHHFAIHNPLMYDIGTQINNYTMRPNGRSDYDHERSP